MDNYEKARVQKQVEQLVKRGLLAGRKIVLFGASGFSKDILTCLREHGFSADMIIDNDSRKIGTHCLGIKVQKPEDALLPFNDENVMLFYSRGFCGEMTAQLERMGYKQKHHIFAMNFKTDDSISIFVYMTFMKLRGLYWYKKITRKHSSDCKVFIAPYTGIGDIYLAGLFFNEYIKRNNITDYVFAVVNKGCEKTADMFGIKNIVLLPYQTSDIISLEHAVGQNLNIITLNDGWLGDPLQWLRGYKELHFEKMFRYFVFGFDDSVRHELPPRKNWQSKIDELFKKHNLLKGKTAILSPHSNTLFELPSNFWESIVEHCKQLGYSVCTNCATKGEKPIKGTEALFFPLGMSIDIVEAAGCFIGIRSGLCDIISSAKAKKIILYEKDGFFYKSSPYEYFSLKKMRLCEDAVELEYNFNEQEKVMEKIRGLLNHDLTGS